MTEKVESSKESNKLVEILSSARAKSIIGTILLCGVGVALPRIFHIFAGSSAGVTFLPMHFAVLIAAMCFGIISASVVAGSSILLSYLLTGMPTIQRLPYMAVELLIYAVLLGILNKKFNPYISLIATIVLGRVLYAGVLFASANIFGLQTYGITVWQSVVAGLPGIALQIICVPILAKIIKKGLKLNG